MNGDFDDDDLSDISDDEMGDRRKKRGGKADKKKNIKRERGLNPEELSDSDDDETGDDREVRFTSDGLVYVDGNGKVTGKVGETGASTNEEDTTEDSQSNFSEDENSIGDLGSSDDQTSAADGSDDECEDIARAAPTQFLQGAKVQGNYHASEQYGGKENWYNGVITAVRKDSKGNTVYDVTYDDGDFEEGMAEKDVRSLPKTKEELDTDKIKISEAAMAKRKKQKAKIRAK